jgi:hypothetical protein
MISIDNLSNDAHQVTHIVLDDSSVVDLSLDYLPAIQKWAFSLTYGTFTIHNKILCLHPNILRQWRRTLPFGLACVANDNCEPFNIDDFINNRIQLYILDTTDILDIETNVIEV